MALLRGAVGCSAVCDSGISWSYSLPFGPKCRALAPPDMLAWALRICDLYQVHIYSKTCLKLPLSKRPKIGFSGSFLLFMFQVCYVFMYVHCSLVVTCWERVDLLALLYVMMFYCLFDLIIYVPSVI